MSVCAVCVDSQVTFIHFHFALHVFLCHQNLLLGTYQVYQLPEIAIFSKNIKAVRNKSVLKTLDNNVVQLGALSSPLCKLANLRSQIMTD